MWRNSQRKMAFWLEAVTYCGYICLIEVNGTSKNWRIK